MPLTTEEVEASAEDRTRRQLPAEPVERKSFFREMLELWREVHERYGRKAANSTPLDVRRCRSSGGGRPSSTPLTTYELLCLLTGEGCPENLKGREVEIQMDERGWVLLPFQLLEITAEDRARCTLRPEPMDRETFHRELRELSREIHERYRKAAD